MPTVELDIRQLADEGGTAPLAPITVTDAVLDEDGNTLTDTLDEIKAGLTTTDIYSGYCAAGSSVVVNGLSDGRVFLFEFNMNPESSSSRSRVFVAGSSAAYYTINLGGTVGYVRLELIFATNTVNFLGTSISGYCITKISRVL